MPVDETDNFGLLLVGESERDLLSVFCKLGEAVAGGYEHVVLEECETSVRVINTVRDEGCDVDKDLRSIGVRVAIVSDGR